jgi:SAM-dependent methyltransferase
LAVSVSSRARLTSRSIALFPGDTLFARVARALCAAECLPRKELYEAWEMARRVRRRFRGGRVVDLACGHGLLAHLLLLLDDSSPRAIAADVRLPRSAERVAAALVRAWPRLEGRVSRLETAIAEVPLERGDLVVSAHACGALTDLVLERAVAAGARVAVLPCCQALARPKREPLEGWIEGPLAVDVARAVRLQSLGYQIHTLRIPAAITPKDRLLLGELAARG